MSNPSQTTPILLHPPLLIEDSIAHMGRTAGIVNRRLIGDLTGLVQIVKRIVHANLPGSSRAPWLVMVMIALLAGGAAAWYQGMLEPYLDQLGGDSSRNSACAQ